MSSPHRIEEALSGFHPGLSYEAYERDPSLRISTLNRFAAGQPEKGDAPALSLGRVFHSLALGEEPEVIDLASYRHAQEMAESFQASPAAKLVDGAFIEPSLFFDQADVACKARLDILAPGHIADLKTTRDLRSFLDDAEEYGYLRQAAWYVDAVAAVMGRTYDTFLFVAVEKKKPYRTEIFELTPPALAEARRHNAVHLALWKRCMATGGGK